MIPNHISILLAQGESQIIEFKSDRANKDATKRLSDNALIETVVCLANSYGGTLLLGVENDGTITGLHPSRLSDSPALLIAFIASRTRPSLQVNVLFEEFESNGKKVMIAVFHVPSYLGQTPVATRDGIVKVRGTDQSSKPTCVTLYPYEILSWQATRGQVDVSAMPILDATWEVFDPLEFARLRNIIEAARGRSDSYLLDLDDVEIAKALRFVVTQNGDLVATITGLLLLGRENALRHFLPAHEVAFQVLRHTDVLVNEFYRGSLLRVLERIWEAFDVRNEEAEVNVGFMRIPIPAYDPRAFREAVNNALVHRDYNRLGTTHIQLHDNRLEISNPGGFVQGVRLDNLLVVEPHPRNPCLADAFKRIGLVERTGRGVNIIYDGQLRNGRPIPSYDRSTEVTVVVTLWGGIADVNFVTFVRTEENRLQKLFSVSELLVLNHLYRMKEIDVKDAQALTHETENNSRALLEKLVELGFIERRGERVRTYHLTALVYRTLGQPEGYVYTRAFEQVQMEQMIMQFVEAHDQITRADVMNLCRVNEDQAYYLLKKLREKKALTLVGSGTTARYVNKNR